MAVAVISWRSHSRDHFPQPPTKAISGSLSQIKSSISGQDSTRAVSSLKNDLPNRAADPNQAIQSACDATRIRPQSTRTEFLNTRDETVLSIYHQFDSVTSGSKTRSEEIAKQIQASLSRLETSLRANELQRSRIEQQQTELTLRSLIKVLPPIEEEINLLKKQINQEAGRLSAIDRAFFLVDAQRMLDSFIAVGDKTLVIFVTETISPDATTPGNYHSYLTSFPDRFYLASNGSPVGTPNDATPSDTGLIVDADGKPYFRYAHYFNRK